MKKQSAAAIILSLLLTLSACGGEGEPVVVQETNTEAPVQAAESAGESAPDTGESGKSCGRDMRWLYDGAGTLTISGEGAMNDYTTLNSPWDKEGVSISVTRLVIGEGVRYLGAYAFAGCCNLVEIEFPETLSRIGEYAFADCLSLQSIRLPASLISIERAAFSGCGLTELELPVGLASVGERAFNQCSALEQLRIPDTLCSVGENAFSDCTALKDVKLGEGCRAEAWFHQNGLSELLRYDGVARAPVSYRWSGTLGEFSWSFDGGVLTVTGQGALPDFTVSGGTAAPWKELGAITEKISVETGVTAVGGGSFAYSNVKLVTLAEGITVIGESAFSGCDALTAVTLPSSVTEIGDGAFGGCRSLESITLPDGLRSIGERAFELCTSLGKLELPASVESIGSGAFAFGISDGDTPVVTAPAGSYAEEWLRTNG